MSAYIYVRTHDSYKAYNACKLGKTTNLADRNSQYCTSEIIAGMFEFVAQIIDANKLDIAERELQNHFVEYKIYKGAGTEFYDIRIMQNISDVLNLLNISHVVLATHQIEKLLVQYSSRDYSRGNELKENDSILIPRADQTEVISAAIEYFKNADKCILVLMCGVGKTLISLWITQTQMINCGILVGVPNVLLLNQWAATVARVYRKNIPILQVCNSITVAEIVAFVQANRNGDFVIITTYASAHKVKDVAIECNFVFGMKINDEAHHLTTLKIDDTKKQYVQMLEIPAKKQISLTATLKTANADSSGDGSCIFNNNSELFGEVIYRRDLLWAIERRIICDYQIQMYCLERAKINGASTIFDEFGISDKKIGDVDISAKTNMRMLYAAYIALLSIQEGHSHHILIYTNNMTHSELVVRWIWRILHRKYVQISELVFNTYLSNLGNETDKAQLIEQFSNSRYGILSCVYCLGEGWDFPQLDGVVFAENMESNIRIVQSALRASRKDSNSPNKVAKIMLPILHYDTEAKNIENPDLQKTRKVLYELGLEDITIEQKIRVYKLDIRCKKMTNLSDDRPAKKIENCDPTFVRNLILKTFSREAYNLPYNKAREILANKCIRSLNEYFEACKQDCRLVTNPQEYYGKQFIGWCYYLSIPEDEYYSINECRNRICEFIKDNPNNPYKYDTQKIYEILYASDTKYPAVELCLDFYKCNQFTNLYKYSNKLSKYMLS